MNLAITKSTPTILAFSKMPGLTALQQFSAQVLGIAFVALVLREVYRLSSGERVNFVGPLTRVAVGFLLVNSLSQIYTELGSLITGVVATVARASDAKLLADAVARAIKDNSCTLSIFDLFSPSELLSLIIHFTLLLVWMVKYLIIDVVWPIMFAITLYCGILAIPIATFPGGGLSNWVKNVISVSLWPIVFQLMLVLLAGAFPTLLRSIVSGNVYIGCGESLEGTLRDTKQTFHFLCICLAYVGFLFFTPFFANKIVRSDSVSLVAGAIVTSAKTLALNVATTGFSRFNNWSRRGGSVLPTSPTTPADRINRRA